ncbi:MULTISPECIES: GreA/GreB family elongation factor [Mycolicibacter]|uniref:Transcription elongation factor GreAB n=2 Tax=Mycolicibacter TaxID=1073531 RepID=A0AA91EXC3_9MYCO|nr:MULTISPECIES: GreA/GreB family elongation factor [Mycobacteriaceae]OBG39276.1 transcription elongation factor GreAB [Mycolicibacter heraklionensis]OBJ28070.1 transcription elongation factor GreAB [Mycolicibacter heraklionensis]OBK80652.1 transcription elongation factor GreAB [Mycolicibacter heraklionensis]PQM53439.1 transcription elongation factor GreAB [Mycolicibacter virginiensis]ULP46359.1 GreA/GreB family elongation factor [Mycolicibacter virginiensis]
MTDTHGVWMTQQTKDRLLAELAELSAPQDVSGGEDISDQQARQARIHQIHDLLAVAVVGQDPPDDGVAEPGMVLTVRYSDGDTETFLLGVRDDDQSGLEVYSPQSPLGMAITGARPGEERTYQVPSGANVTVTLLDAVPYGLHQTQHPA